MPGCALRIWHGSASFVRLHTSLPPYCVGGALLRSACHRPPSKSPAPTCPKPRGCDTNTEASTAGQSLAGEIRPIISASARQIDYTGLALCYRGAKERPAKGRGLRATWKDIEPQTRGHSFDGDGIPVYLPCSRAHCGQTDRHLSAGNPGLAGVVQRTQVCCSFSWCKV